MYANDPVPENLRTTREDRPWTESELAEVPAHVVAPEKSDLRVEVVADHETFQLDAVPISRVVELRAIAGVVTCEPVGARLRPVRVDGQVVVEGERAVDAVRLVAAGAALCDRPAREDHPDAALAQHVALHAQDREVRRRRSRHGFIVRLNVQQRRH